MVEHISYIYLYPARRDMVEHISCIYLYLPKYLATFVNWADSFDCLVRKTVRGFCLSFERWPFFFEATILWLLRCFLLIKGTLFYRLMVYLRKQVSNLVFYTHSSGMVISGQFTWETFRNKLQITFLDDYLSGLYVQKQITKYLSGLYVQKQITKYLSGLYVQKQITKYLSGLYVQKQITEYLWIVCLKTNYRIPVDCMLKTNYSYLWIVCLKTNYRIPVDCMFKNKLQNTCGLYVKNKLQLPVDCMFKNKLQNTCGLYV